MRRRAKPTKGKVEAKLPGVRKSRESEGSRVRELEKRLAEALDREAEALRHESEALERETATAEILKVISSSPTDVQPVFEAIARNAVTLCGGIRALVLRFDGVMLHVAGHHNIDPDGVEQVGQAFPRRPGRDYPPDRAFLDRIVVHVPDLQAATEFAASTARRRGVGSLLAVPLLREREAVGVISLARDLVGPFSPQQIEVLQTFADQAVIAIENVRLFNETKEALDRQTATAEILRVISLSPADLQSVFDAMVDSAMRLFHAWSGNVCRFDGELVHLVATRGGPDEAGPSIRDRFPTRPTAGLTVGRCILDRAVIQIDDAETEVGLVQATREMARARGWRSALAVPMLRAGEPVGAIMVTRKAPGGFEAGSVELLQTFADQAVIAIENVRLFRELQTRNSELTEALERQTATSEILRVISSSPTDLQPVMDAVAENAARLCGATDAHIRRIEGDTLRLVARFGSRIPVAAPDVIPISRDYPSGLSVIERQTIHIDDILPRLETEFPRISRELRTVLATPLLREGVPIGTIVIRRAEVQPFTDAQIGLLQTFADQAVIAIENVRLFTELEARNRDLTAALEQQTATSAILRVISQSPTDVQPVFDEIVRNAVRLCDGLFGSVYRFDGERIHSVAHYNFTQEQLAHYRRTWPRGLSDPGDPVTVIRTGSVLRIPNMEIHPGFLASPPEVRENLRWRGVRSAIGVPMLRQDQVIGAILVSHHGVDAFTDAHVDLLKTFADQAVIAIENVRLFTELQARNRDLIEALDRQTATADILRAISQAQTDVQPVFDTIVRSAAQLCHAVRAAVFLTDGQMLLEPANYGGPPEALAAMRARYPRPVGMDTTSGMAVLTRSVVQVPDTEEPSTLAHVRQSGRMGGFRSCVTVPMMREGQAVGAILVARREPGRFSDADVTLLKTFADQAVIAVENARLLTELQEKNRALTESNAQVTEALDRQTATADVLRIIAQSPTELQPVLDAIAASAVRLCAASDAVIERLEGDRFYNAAHAGTQMKGLLGHPLPLTRRFPGGRAVLDRQRVIIDDIQLVAESEYPDTLELLKLNTVRSCAEIPLLSEGKPLGNIAVLRAEVRPFTDAEIALLETFADQAVIAIENVRLFTELQEKNQALTAAHAQVTEALDQQTATSEVLRVIAGSPTDLQPVLDALVQSASRLCQTADTFLLLVEGDRLRVVARTVEEGTIADSIHRGWVAGRAVVDAQTIHVEDLSSAGAEFPRGAEIAARFGHRTALALPLFGKGLVIGTLFLRRQKVQRFSDKEIALLQTFSDQAVIAIENVRLFTELQARTNDLTRSVDELTALRDVSRALSSTLDLETVLQTIVTRAVQIARTAGCTIWEYDEPRAEFRLLASHYADEADATVLQAAGRVTTIPEGQGVTTRVMERRQPVQIHDITTARDYESPIRRPLVEAGHRALLGVPLLSEDEVIGVLAVTRKIPGEFEPEIVRLLSTFATQSTLAIQNARLYRELADQGRQLEVASRHKSEFLASMSHELRTPLNGILGFNEMILDNIYGEVPPELREPLTEIQNSGRHLLRLINNVLDLSKIEAGRMELALGDYAVHDTVAQVRASLHPLAADKGLEFVTTVPADLPLAHGDAGRIAQCLTNLAGNAIKFTQQGRVEIVVELQGELLVYRVSDTGIGIAPDRIGTLFTEFRQADATIASEFGGSGLGLSITRKFAEMHGGRVWVESEPGKGSKFFLAVPLRLGGGAPA